MENNELNTKFELDINQESEIEEKQINSRPWLYKKGQSGNPAGKKKGNVSMKTYVKNKLLEMDEEQREIFLEGVDKKTIWEMSEGKPKQDVDISAEITSKVINIDE